MSLEHMSNPGPETAGDIRDRHIFELTGIMPDPRQNIPKEETREWIRRTQADDPEAMERLIASRLRWVYDKFARKPQIMERFDLGMEDIMQMGSLATLEAAKNIKNPDSDAINALLHAEIPYFLGNLVMESKLIPAIGDESGQKLVNARNSSQDERIRDEVVPSGVHVASVLAAGRDVYDLRFGGDDPTAQTAVVETLARSLDDLDADQRFVVEAYFGLGDFADKGELNLEEIKVMRGISHSSVWRTKNKALERLGAAYESEETPRLAA